MINLAKAAQTAIFAKMAADVPPELGGAYQHVRQDTQPPFNKIGQIESNNEAGKGAQYESFTIEILSVFRGPGRAPLLDQMHAVREALDEQPIEAAGVNFSTPLFLSAVASDAASDGVTYVGLSTFEIYAEPADA